MNTIHLYLITPMNIIKTTWEIIFFMNNFGGVLPEHRVRHRYLK